VSDGGRTPEARAARRGQQQSVPYLEAVASYVEARPSRFHVPGHKGGAGADPQVRALFGERAFLYDVPQDIEGVDVGPWPTPYDRAELLAAEAYGAAQSWFLTNGASQGNHALCLALARDRPVVVQRNSHASVVDGLVLSGGRPHFALPEYDYELGMALCVTPLALERALDQASGARAVFLVSPTYYGATADIQACAEVCHAAGAALCVDQAWGPHYGFHPAVPPCALALGADAMLTSTHKIGGSLTQSAMLHVADSPWLDRVKLARAVRIVRSTSPSSLLLGSLDAARRQLATRGRELLEETLARSIAERRSIEAIDGCEIVPAPGSDWPGVRAWDPMRIVIDVRRSGASGHEVAAALRHLSPERVQVELATHATLVLVLGVHEPSGPLERFPAQLRSVLQVLAGEGRPAPVARSPQPLSGEPIMTPREAWVAGSDHVPVEQAIGAVSAEAIAGYPPGIPTLLPGERVTADVVAHLHELVRAGVRLHGASDPGLRTIAVVTPQERSAESEDSPARAAPAARGARRSGPAARAPSEDHR
jgi:arginine decarboxylase